MKNFSLNQGGGMNMILQTFLGVIIGAASPIIIIFIQQFFQTRRDRIKIASKLAIWDYEKDLEIVKHNQSGHDAYIAPISVYLIFHTRLLEELANGKITEEKIKLLVEEKRKIGNAFP